MDNFMKNMRVIIKLLQHKCSSTTEDFVKQHGVWKCYVERVFDVGTEIFPLTTQVYIELLFNVANVMFGYLQWSVRWATIHPGASNMIFFNCSEHFYLF